MPTALIIGATRGLGQALTSIYADRSWTVLGTARSDKAPSASDTPKNTTWLTGIDLSQPTCGKTLAEKVKPHGSVDVVIITAGYFGLEEFDSLDWEKEIKMYTLSAVAPPFLVRALVEGALLKKGAKVVLVGSESGSVTLRHKKEGGGNYGHHASKAAVNMVSKLLSLDLLDEGVAVGVVHPGFMRTEMTKSVGFDKFWDEGGAVTPDVAAKSLVEFVDRFGIDSTGEYWAPRGPADIGTAEETLGKNLSTPLKLPY